GHSAIVRRVAFTLDGKYAITGSMDKSVRIWDLVSGETIRTLRLPIGPGFEGAIQGIAVSPDGKTLAASGVSVGHAKNGFPIFLVDWQSGQVVKNLKGHRNTISYVAFSPNGKQLASSSTDRTVIVWNLDNGQIERLFAEHKTQVRQVGFAPDGVHLVSAAED